MNETVEFSYWFSDEHGQDEKRVLIRKQNEAGLSTNDLCEAFENLVESAGFSVDNIYNYFKTDEKSSW